MAFFDSRVGKFFVEEFDLSGFTTEMAANSERELRDVTVLGDTGHKFIPGHHVDKISWSGLYDDTATSGSEAVLGGVLRTATAAKVMTLWPGDAELGDIGYGTDQGWTVNPEANVAIGNVVTYSGGELEASKMDRLKSFGPKLTKTATFQGSTIDDSAEALVVQSGTVSGTEADGSADLDDTAALFTSAIRDGFHWVRLEDDGGDVVHGYIGKADDDGDDTRVSIFDSHARDTQNWIEGDGTAFDMADTPLRYRVFRQGFKFIYHIFAWSASGGTETWVINIQHSLDGSSWADLTGAKATLSTPGTGGAKLSSTTQLMQPFTRLEVERITSAGSLTYFGGFERLIAENS